MNEALIQALLDYFTALRDRLDVRVVVLRAEGQAFCAGLDLAGWDRDPDAGPVHQGWRTQRMIAAVMQAMRKCPRSR